MEPIPDAACGHQEPETKSPWPQRSNRMTSSSDVLLHSHITAFLAQQHSEVRPPAADGNKKRTPLPDINTRGRNLGTVIPKWDVSIRFLLSELREPCRKGDVTNMGARGEGGSETTRRPNQHERGSCEDWGACTGLAGTALHHVLYGHVTALLNMWVSGAFLGLLLGSLPSVCFILFLCVIFVFSYYISLYPILF